MSMFEDPVCVLKFNQRLAKKRRNCVSSNSLLGFVGIAEDFFSNNPFGCLIQIFVQCLLNLKEFRPERFVDE